jgi:DNA-binding XRE family transcriptional regulator
MGLDSFPYADCGRASYRMRTIVRGRYVRKTAILRFIEGGGVSLVDRLAAKLGENVRSMRRERGFSQDALALACGLDRSYMGRIERGEVNITIEKLYMLAETLGCKPSKLLPTDSGDARTSPEPYND